MENGFDDQKERSHDATHEDGDEKGKDDAGETGDKADESGQLDVAVPKGHLVYIPASPTFQESHEERAQEVDETGEGEAEHTAEQGRTIAELEVEKGSAEGKQDGRKGHDVEDEAVLKVNNGYQDEDTSIEGEESQPQ